MMRRIRRLGGVFCGSAALAFAFLISRPAISSSRNVAGPSCYSTRSTSSPYQASYWCSMVTDNTTHTVPALTGAFFDFSCAGSGYDVHYSLVKYSFSGAYSSDYATYSCTTTDSHDVWLSASSVLTNASTDDYLYAALINPFETYGVQLQFSP
jgi:hypothetical protein